MHQVELERPRSPDLKALASRSIAASLTAGSAEVGRMLDPGPLERDQERIRPGEKPAPRRLRCALMIGSRASGTRSGGAPYCCVMPFFGGLNAAVEHGYPLRIRCSRTPRTRGGAAGAGGRFRIDWIAMPVAAGAVRQAARHQPQLCALYRRPQLGGRIGGGGGGGLLLGFGGVGKLAALSLAVLAVM